MEWRWTLSGPLSSSACTHQYPAFENPHKVKGGKGEKGGKPKGEAKGGSQGMTKGGKGKVRGREDWGLGKKVCGNIPAEKHRCRSICERRYNQIRHTRGKAKAKADTVILA